MKYLIAGPCVVEHSADWLVDVAGQVKEIVSATCPGAELIFKASFDKANRTTLSGKRGIGYWKGLEALEMVSKQVGVKTTTDVHEPHQVYDAARVVDVVQIPAMLARQTDLIEAAARSYAKQVSIKVPVWADAQEAFGIRDKYQDVRIKYNLAVNPPWLIYRGTQFGPGKRNLKIDWFTLNTLSFPHPGDSFFRGIPKSATVLLDLTHTNHGKWQESLQMAHEGAAQGELAGFFAETHPAPAQAWCDGKHALSFNQLAVLLEEVAPKFSGEAPSAF